MKIYNDFDMAEFQPTGNKYTFIEKKKEFASLKICSNPKVVYKSTSHGEVFEIRDKERERTGIKQVNRFIEVGNPSAGSFESDDDVDFTDIRPQCQPWQLKTTYKIAERQEVEIDDGDEDYLLFAAQPFETAMNIGHHDLLSHIDTKFFARRSDIIVSSTLSITLTPTMEDHLQEKQHATMTDAEAWAWVNRRQEFRSRFRVECARLRVKTYHDRTASVVSLLESDPEEDGGTVNSEGSQAGDKEADDAASSSSPGASAKQFANVYSMNKRKLIPPNLLSAELPEGKRAQMGKAELAVYRQWV